MNHPKKALKFVEDQAQVNWHDQALWYVRQKRDRAVQQIPEWEGLRNFAEQIKKHTLSKLGYYLELFEKQATGLGAQVHWARDAEEHNQIIYSLLRERKITRVVKSKSMLTEECHLNAFLEQSNIEVVDTDLGERIVQLGSMPPSHIVLPAVHLRREEVSKLFHQKLGTDSTNIDPKYLADAARAHLRAKLLAAEAGITGVNFAIAETGGLVVCTNEGNADLGTVLPKLHIACLGIEKLIPRFQDLGVFIRLLARSATGQAITSYTSHFNGPRPGGELHIVLVDNGRSEIINKKHFKASLQCIRCGACLNTCPIYRRSGGYSYSATIPGPIGSILSPHKDPDQHASLPYASSLCGSCTAVCPVKINIHEQLLQWRGQLVGSGKVSMLKKLTLKVAARILANKQAYLLASYLVKIGLTITPRFLLYSRLNIWGRRRELPILPKESFRSWWSKNREC